MFFSWPLFLLHPTLNQQHNAFPTIPPYFTLDNINKTSFQWCRVHWALSSGVIKAFKHRPPLSLHMSALRTSEGSWWGTCSLFSRLRSEVTKRAASILTYSTIRGSSTTKSDQEQSAQRKIITVLQSRSNGCASIFVHLKPSNKSQLFSSYRVTTFTVKCLRDSSRSE